MTEAGVRAGSLASPSSSQTLVIPSAKVKTLREQLERIRITIEECSIALGTLDLQLTVPLLLQKYFPEGVRKAAKEFIVEAKTDHRRLRDRFEYENLIWTTQEPHNPKLWARIADLLVDVERAQVIIERAKSNIFHHTSSRPFISTVPPIVARRLGTLFLSAQDKVSSLKQRRVNFSRHPAEIHVTVETATDGQDSAQLRQDAPPKQGSISLELIRSFLGDVKRRIPSESESFHSHIVSLFDNCVGLNVTTDSAFITALATALHLYPEVLENFNAILSRISPFPAKLYVIVDTLGTVAFVTIVSVTNDIQIIPISLEMRAMSADPWSLSRHELQSLITSHKSGKLFSHMDVRWSPALTTLIQLACPSELQDHEHDDVYTRQCRNVLRRLAKNTCGLPASYLLEDIEREGNYAVSGGGFADIWRGRLPPDNRVMCLKVLRFYMEDDREELFKHLYHEVAVWKQLEHRNILPFLGISLKLFSPSFCMVSPWMDNGQVMSFLKRHPHHNRHKVICEIAEGIKYLHSLSPPVVHGDIKGSNILVTDDHVCCLADFGLAAVAESHAFSTTSTRPGGTMRWLAPEVFLPNQFPNCSKLARDVYAFGCTVLEVITGREPFSEPRLPDAAVMTAVIRGERPARSQGNPWCTDALWALIEECWTHDAAIRPSAKRARSDSKRRLSSGDRIHR
ncbi:hypothetical protein D9758_008382 [Tetrapyrgos nigripes]|uniref:Protein kinase domain-containing protein n=1 Tax=Tetrapyrgos nigripes TaxID=182062 RepID=A0A8H5LN25_9AGAR|nr:hypothetical protein D9758_008382 [Tetrapyrgos nigripes]